MRVVKTRLDGVTVRPILISEHAVVMKLLLTANAAIDPPELAHLGPWDERVYAVALRQLPERADAALVLVAVDDDGVLGTITYVDSCNNEWSEFEEDDAAGVRMLAVAPHAQGRGIGRRLMAACIEQAALDGSARVILHTAWWMSAAQSLYRELGFVRTPMRDIQVADKDPNHSRGVTLFAFEYLL